jgi:hypothetical protein
VPLLSTGDARRQRCEMTMRSMSNTPTGER